MGARWLPSLSCAEESWPRLCGMPGGVPASLKEGGALRASAACLGNGSRPEHLFSRDTLCSGCPRDQLSIKPRTVHLLVFAAGQRFLCVVSARSWTLHGEGTPEAQAGLPGPCPLSLSKACFETLTLGAVGSAGASLWAWGLWEPCPKPGFSSAEINMYVFVVEWLLHFLRSLINKSQ